MLGIALLTLGFPVVFANSATNSQPSWNDCGVSEHGLFTVNAPLGSNVVSVTWSSPSTSYENLAGCRVFPRTNTAITVEAQHPNLLPVPATVTCNGNVCDANIYLTVQEFVGKGYIGVPYHLEYGDYVVCIYTITYGNYFQHSWTLDMRITN